MTQLPVTLQAIVKQQLLVAFFQVIKQRRSVRRSLAEAGRLVGSA